MKTKPTKPTKKWTPESLAAVIDHTFLSPAGDVDAVRKLCREAKKYGFASVCVNPAEVKLAAKLLKGSDVKVCTVIGFPLGQNACSIKLMEAETAVIDGARELDFVLNQRLLKATVAGDKKALEELTLELTMCGGGIKKFDRKDLGSPSIVTKLIIECCNLTEGEKVAASLIAKETGFDFVKTSTGFGSGGATVEDVKLIRKAVGPKMGIKAAGGIRTLDDALAMLKAGATRLGCSAGVEIVRSFHADSL